MRNIVRSIALSLVVIAAVAAPSPLYAVGCFAQYQQDVNACSNMQDWDDRTICGLDAGVKLAGCVRRGILGV